MMKISNNTKGILFGVVFGLSAFVLMNYLDFLCVERKNKEEDQKSGIGGYWSNVGGYLNKAIKSYEKEQQKI